MRSGTLAGLVVLGMLVWFARLLSSESVMSPWAVAQQRRWRKSSQTHIIDVGRSAQQPARITGYRSRVVPNAPGC
jgi:hypothetical protein